MGSMTSLPAEVDGDDEEPTEREQARPEPLALVRASPPAVVRTYADGEATVRTWSRLRRFEYRVPAGWVHAADLGARRDALRDALVVVTRVRPRPLAVRTDRQ